MILDTVSHTAATLATAIFGLLATGGVSDAALRLVNGGTGILGQAGLEPWQQYGVAGLCAATCVILGKMVISYHERMLADRDKQIAELHARVRELEKKNDDAARAVLDAGLDHMADRKP